MQNIADKVDGVTTLTASEFNDHKNELQRFVEESGQTLASASTDQVRVAASTYSRSLFVRDSSSTANVLTLSRPNSLKDANKYYDGLTVLFSTPNATTGAVTASFNGLASKKVRTPTDGALTTGAIKANSIYTLVYDSALDSGSGGFALYVAAGADVQKNLLAEYTVTGSAVTSVDFSGLDINTHKSYRIELELINATSSVVPIYCYVNGDSTLTNYYSQGLVIIGGTYSSSNTNSPIFCRFTSSTSGTFTKATGSVALSAGATTWTMSSTNKYSASSMYIEFFGGFKTATVTNITQLTFASSVANAIGVGSKIRIYRGDL